MVAPLILIIDFFFGLITGLIVIMNGYEKHIWALITQNQTSEQKTIPHNKWLILFLCTAFGFVSFLFFLIAKRNYSDTI